MNKETWHIEQLNAKHHTKQFNSGNDALNDYLQYYAKQHQKRNISRTFVLESKNQVIAYYTLATGSLDYKDPPPEYKHPRYPISIVRLARLAVDKHKQGKGIGGLLLHDALKRCLQISRVVGLFAIVVDAKNDHAANFYQHYGFMMLEEHPLTLFLPMKTIEKLFN